MTHSAFAGFGLLLMFQLVNVSWVEGLESDFSNMLLEITEANGSHYAPYEIAGMEAGAWALVNVSVPEENYSLNVLAALPQGNESNDKVLEIPYQEGFEPDFSNLLIQFVQPDGNSSNVSYSVLALNESQWVMVGLERPPSEGETISILAVQSSTPDAANESQASEAAPSETELPGAGDAQQEAPPVSGNPQGDEGNETGVETQDPEPASPEAPQPADGQPQNSSILEMPAENTAENVTSSVVADENATADPAAHDPYTEQTVTWNYSEANTEGMDGVYFDGTADYAVVTGSENISMADNHVKINVTAKLEGGSGVLVSRYDYLHGKTVRLEMQGGKIRFFVADGNVPILLESAGNYDDGQFHSVLASLSPGNASLYVDGVLESEKDASRLGNMGSDAPFSVGANSGYLDWMGQTVDHFRGTIRDAEISFRVAE